MRNWITAIVLGSFLFAMEACAPHQAQDPCGYVQNSYNERISWKGQLPVQMRVHTNVPSQYLSAIHSAVDTWNQGAGKTVFEIVDDHYAGSTSSQDGINVISFSSTWDTSLNSQQAKTQVYWIGDQIQEADVKINASSLNGNAVFSFYVGQAVPNAINFQALILHELGHVLGLKHMDGVGSVMATYLPNDSDRTALGSVDNSDLKCEY